MLPFGGTTGNCRSSRALLWQLTNTSSSDIASIRSNVCRATMIVGMVSQYRRVSSHAWVAAKMAARCASSFLNFPCRSSRWNETALKLHRYSRDDSGQIIYRPSTRWTAGSQMSSTILNFLPLRSSDFCSSVNAARLETFSCRSAKRAATNSVSFWRASPLRNRGDPINVPLGKLECWSAPRGRNRFEGFWTVNYDRISIIFSQQLHVVHWYEWISRHASVFEM